MNTTRREFLRAAAGAAAAAAIVPRHVLGGPKDFNAMCDSRCRAYRWILVIALGTAVPAAAVPRPRSPPSALSSPAITSYLQKRMVVWLGPPGSDSS